MILQLQAQIFHANTLFNLYDLISIRSLQNVVSLLLDKVCI